MPGIEINTSASTYISKFYEVTKNSSKSFRIRDIVPFDTGVRRTNEESYSILSEWMKEEKENPFSMILDRLPTSATKESIKVRNKSSEPSTIEALSANRSKFTDGYDNMVEVENTVSVIKSAVKRSKSILPELTISNKEIIYKELELNEKRIEELLLHYPNAKFQESASHIVERIKNEGDEVLLMSREVGQGIKSEIRPTLEEIRKRNECSVAGG